MTQINVEAAITAQDTFTEPLDVGPGERVSISIDIGTSTTATLQRKLDGENWRDVQSWSANAEETYEGDEQCPIRLGVKSGNYGSGATTVRLGKSK